MIVVSDTSALTSLLQISREDLLLRLYEEVKVPEAVEQELRRAHSSLPSWLQVISVRDRLAVTRLESQIDRGEAEAIVAMKEGHGDILLIDERRGRLVALREGVPFIGLVGVLVSARRLGHIASLTEVLNDLEFKADFRLAPRLKSEALRSVGE